jgi:hypothetical protein
MLRAARHTIRAPGVLRLFRCGYPSHRVAYPHNLPRLIDIELSDTALRSDQGPSTNT